MSDQDINEEVEKLDEDTDFVVEEHIKIFDPDSGEIYVEGRG